MTVTTGARPQSTRSLSEAERLVTRGIAELHGRAAARGFAQQRVAPQPLDGPSQHWSHERATAMLARYRTALGPAYRTLHTVARFGIELASEENPAPHLFTTYWTLEEATGLSRRTLQRHLAEDGHPWSSTVRHLLDIRLAYGTMPRGPEADPCIVGVVIRFFPRGRLSPHARVKRWGTRDLIAESDAGRTRPTRATDRPRYARRDGEMSQYAPAIEVAARQNWFLEGVEWSVSRRQQDQRTNADNLYWDTPTRQLLDALLDDFRVRLEGVSARGGSVTRARARWVDDAARELARRFGDDRPPRGYVTTVSPDAEPKRGDPIGLVEREGRWYQVYADGFVNLWRQGLWTALRTEMYGNTRAGWSILRRMVINADEACRGHVRRPTAWAWSIAQREGLKELRRDYGAGAVAHRPRAAR